jgi:HAMP domain-containing protein
MMPIRRRVMPFLAACLVLLPATASSQVRRIEIAAREVVAGDLRLSLEERYGTQEGHVCAVRRAANTPVRDCYLLPEDAGHPIAEAAVAALLPASTEATAEVRRVAERVCR